MATFACALPFNAGETWCRRNFFCPEGKPIGATRVLSVDAPGLPAVVESEAAKAQAQTGWGGQTPVVQVYVRLASPAGPEGVAVATVEAEVAGTLVSCAEAPDACEAGSSG